MYAKIEMLILTEVFYYDELFSIAAENEAYKLKLTNQVLKGGAVRWQSAKFAERV